MLSDSMWIPRGRNCPRPLKAILDGSSEQVHVRYKNRYGRTRSYYAEFEGVLAFLQRRMEQTESEWAKERYEGFMRDIRAPYVRAPASSPRFSPSH